MNLDRIAVIDLGTNTFHLLIAQAQADGSFQTLYQEKKAVKIGKGGISRGVISDEAIMRALVALKHFRQQIDTFHVASNRIFASATSAVRNASNGTDLVTAVFQETGIRIEVISGDREAEYIYYGVREAVSIGEKMSLIMDIGGGSVEFIICNGEKIAWIKSFEIGGQRLLDQFMQSDPISPQAVGRLYDYLDATLIALTNAVHQYAPEVLIGASGSFETLCAIYYKRVNIDFDENAFVHAHLPMEAFAGIFQELLQKNKTERLAIPGMAEMRADMIVVACCLINFVLTKYHLSTIHVSAYALKEGVLHTVLKEREQGS